MGDGGQSKSSPRLLRYLRSDSCGIAVTEAGALQSWMKIRLATEADRDAIWNIFREVVASGDTYALDSNISREDALAYWFALATHTYVAEQAAIGVVGTYILRPNQSGGGSHVANAGIHGLSQRSGTGNRSRNGRALLRRSAPPRFSRDAIQLCDFHEYRCDPSMAGPRLRNRGHIVECFPSSR